MGGDYFALCLALEELGKVDQSVAITLEAGVSLGAMPVYRFGNEDQKQEWLPLLASGKALGAFGLTEAGGGTDAGATKTTAQAGRRALGHQRQQAVHHQLRHRHHQAGHRHRGHRGGRRQEGDLVDPGAGAHDGLHRRARLQQGRLERLGHPPAELRRRPGARRRTCSASAAAATRTSCASSTRAASRSPRCRSAPRRAASTRCVKYAKEREAFGAADRHLPGHRVQDRPHGGPRARRPHRLLRRGRADAGGQAVQEGRPRSPSWSPARPRWTTPATPPRSSAATAS